MRMQNYNTFKSAIKATIAKKKITIKNKANDLYIVSPINETSLLITYSKMEFKFVAIGVKQTGQSQHHTVRFDFSAMFKYFLNYANVSISYKIWKKTGNYFSNQKEGNAFVYILYFLQLATFRATYRSTIGATYFVFVNSRFLQECFSAAIKNGGTNYLSGNVAGYFNHTQFTIRERFQFQFINHAISKSNGFRGISVNFPKLFNKLFVTTKQKASDNFGKYRGLNHKKVASIHVFYSRLGSRRKATFSKGVSSFFGKCGGLRSAVVLKTIKRARRSITIDKKISRLINAYPKVYLGALFTIKKAKKIVKIKKISKKNVWFISSKSGSFFVKSNFAEIKPSSYALKLFNTNANKGQSSPFGLAYLKSLLTLISGNRFSIYMLNAISLSRFAFDNDCVDAKVKMSQNVTAVSVSRNKNNKYSAGSKTSYRFLMSLERERLSRFRYVAVYIQDLIRISFFSIFLKKATFLVSFFAFTLSKLPRNRKETKFIRFLRKLVKVFASQRKEILGLRIRFKGRVNRWRRTKHIVGERGSIAFNSYSTRRDYGMAQAITRKGTLGIHFWIVYQPFFTKHLRLMRLRYLQFPKISVMQNLYIIYSFI